MGIAQLLIMAMAKEGVSKADAIKKIWMVDSKGLIVKVRDVRCKPCVDVTGDGVKTLIC